VRKSPTALEFSISPSSIVCFERFPYPNENDVAKRNQAAVAWDDGYSILDIVSDNILASTTSTSICGSTGR
jgi:hypothetical protein